MSSYNLTQQPLRLFNRNYLLLWQGQAVSMVGAGLSKMALILWVVETTNSATMMGSLLMFAAIPNILLGPLSGAVADRFSRKKIIVACDVISGLLSIILAGAILFYSRMPDFAAAIIYIVYVGMAVTGLFFGSAVVALTPELVPLSKVPAANALEMAVSHIAHILGKTTCGFLYRSLGASAIFVLDGITFFISAASESFIDAPRRLSLKTSGLNDTFRQLLLDTREGFLYVVKDPGLRSVILVYSGINFFIEPFFVLLPFYVRDSSFLNASVDWVGYLFAGLALGTTAGYWLASILPKHGKMTGWLVLSSLVIMGLGYCLLAIIRNQWTALLLIAGNGILGGFTSNYIQSLLQTQIPAHIRGRVLSVLTTLVMCLSPIALGVSGFAADFLNHRVDMIFAVCGVMMTIMSFVGLTYKEFRVFIGKAHQYEEGTS